jgi:predicted unusual protein kinase regulating ubiquinone biosynthesis (AarF/ABC1/UbiB family)
MSIGRNKDDHGTSRAVAVPSSRISRLTRLGAMTAGVAGNMAWNGAAQMGQGRRPSLRSLLLTPGNVSRIADQLAQMRGAAMKVGQLVSMDTGDVLPPELTEIMGRLRQDAHFMPPRQLKEVLERNWPTGWLTQFRHFDVRPMAAASIGQVHRAQLKDGRDLAIKIQYPGVARSIDSDVANVGALIRMAGLLPAGFDLAPYLEAACAQLHEETDYLLEANQLKAFRALLKGDDRFCLPEVHEGWSTREILSMSFVEGAAIESTFDLPQEVRNRIAHTLFDLLLSELFSFGLMQTDPNFANYRYDRAEGRIILLDFGATRRLEPGIVDQYRRLLRAGMTRDREALHAVSLEIGFFDAHTSQVHRDQILRMMAMVFAAVAREAIFDFSRTDLPDRMQNEGMMLAQSGFIPPTLPIDVLYLQRKFGGMFLLAARLSAKVPLRNLLEGYLLADSAVQR